MVSYEPANSFETPRFSGIRTFMRLPNVQDLENADAAIVGAPFDVDFADPTFAPGTGTLEVGGFTSLEALELGRGLSNIEIAGCDVVEVYPQYDGPGQITALLAATVAFEFLSLLAKLKRAAKTDGEAISRSV